MKFEFTKTAILYLLSFLFISSCRNADPKTAADYIETANAYLDNKEYANAIEPLNKAIELDPTNPDA